MIKVLDLIERARLVNILVFTTRQIAVLLLLLPARRWPVAVENP